VTLTSLDDGREIDLSKLLEPTRRKALLSATLKAAREAFADLGTVDTTDAEPPEEVTGAHFDLSHQWGVERGRGYWYTVGQASCWPYVACGDGSRTFFITDFSAPRALVGHDELFPSLADVKTVLPGVMDAVSSPRRDLLVALSEDSLVVFSINNGRLGVPVLRLPVSGRIVMAQWAVGRFVPLWSAQLRQFLGAPR
jgi:hypothetical protein